MTGTRKLMNWSGLLAGSITKEGDIVVASDSKSKLWKDTSLKRTIQNCNVKYVDVARVQDQR